MTEPVQDRLQRVARIIDYALASYATAAEGKGIMGRKDLREAISSRSAAEIVGVEEEGVAQSQPKSTLHGAHTEAEPAASEEPLPWNEITRGEAMGRWVLQAHEIYGLHPRTAKLVRTFAAALAHKLRAAEKKYGYSDGWASGDWEAECQRMLLEHVAKGDPLDVAAYAAFCWQNRWSTAADTSERSILARETVPNPSLGSVGGEGSSNASLAATRDHSLAAPEAEPSAVCPTCGRGA